MAFHRASRYKNTKLFLPADTTGAPFTGTRVRHISTANGVLEHTVQEGDRLDLLALHYYNDDRKWWRILDANPYLIDAGEIALDNYKGETIVIPSEQDQ